jgi:hypothetical protein
MTKITSFDRKGLTEVGFHGFIPIRILKDELKIKDWRSRSHWGNIPKDKQGIYAILRESTSPPVFLEKSTGGHFKGRNLEVSEKELGDHWVESAHMLNVGKAGGEGLKSTLRGRIRQYIRYGMGKNAPHEGGRYIWYLADNGDLLVAWKVVDNPREEEDGIAVDFAKRYGKKPFAYLA